MIDKASAFKLIDSKLPVYHGETEIVLKNVKTGLVERHFHENTFQSAVLRDQFKNMPNIKQNPYNVSAWTNDIQKALVGGLFLFRDTIPTGTYFMPAGNKMVGNAAKGTVNHAYPSELGSWNEVESSQSSNSITQVFDFMTHQGNGQINCVCLTSAQGGLGGYGNASGYTTSSAINLREYWQTQDYSNFGYWLHAENGRDYYFTYTSDDQYLTVSIRRNVSNIGSVFAGTDETKKIKIEGSLTFDGWSLVSSYDSRIGNKVIMVGEYVGSGIFRLVPTGTCSVSPGGTFYYWEYDTATDTLTRKSFTNSSSVTIVSYYYGYHDNAGRPQFFRDGNIAVEDENFNSVYIFRLSDSVLLHNTTSFYPMSHYMGNRTFAIGQVSPELYMSTDSENSCARLIDITAGTEYKTNWEQYILNDFNGTGLSAVKDNGNFIPNMLGYNPLYLATINNLDNPVNKTAAQTMKVTYTLTEESE